jgi:hypothetical protein
MAFEHVKAFSQDDNPDIAITAQVIFYEGAVRRVSAVHFLCRNAFTEQGMACCALRELFVCWWPAARDCVRSVVGKVALERLVLGSVVSLR